MTEAPVYTINPYQRRILVALNVLGKHVFAGIESPQERSDRRHAQRIERAGNSTGRAARRALTQAVHAQARRTFRAERRAEVTA